MESLLESRAVGGAEVVSRTGVVGVEIVLARVVVVGAATAEMRTAVGGTRVIGVADAGTMASNEWMRQTLKRRLEVPAWCRARDFAVLANSRGREPRTFPV